MITTNTDVLNAHVDEMQELGLQLGDAHAEIRRQAKEIEALKDKVARYTKYAIGADGEIEALKADAERLIWLEQQHWDKDELFELVNNWETKDGTRHPGGLMDAIGAAIAQQKETK